MGMRCLGIEGSLSILSMGWHVMVVIWKRWRSFVRYRSVLVVLLCHIYHRQIMHRCRRLVLSWIHIWWREVDRRSCISNIRIKSRWRRILSPLHFNFHFAICFISCMINLFCSATVGWATTTSLRLTSSLLSPIMVFPLSEFGLGKESVGPFDLVK